MFSLRGSTVHLEPQALEGPVLQLFQPYSSFLDEESLRVKVTAHSGIPFPFRPWNQDPRLPNSQVKNPNLLPGPVEATSLICSQKDTCVTGVSP